MAKAIMTKLDKANKLLDKALKEVSTESAEDEYIILNYLGNLLDIEKNRLYSILKLYDAKTDAKVD